ncbi:cell wall-binding repeat-containing protein [Clostridium sp. MT-14]|uniref:cell wall-binding repeat-containing protein n=1 Tax=unclassified Clostridium TaxID=2614128 RepID=UPI00156CC08F|nr:cell wall-binding repeat-containing protein [Clostridium sp. HV4-5-A1G]CAB1251349.1 exported hypothetical protein [Clostridiaceae bacterium BL-3]
MNRKKIVSLLLTLGILATPLVAPQYTTAENLSNKVYAYDETVDETIQDGNKAQKAPLQTATGQVGEGITTPARMSESMTYEEAMSSPYKVEAAPNMLTLNDFGGVIPEISKFNLDGKIYHYQYKSDEGVFDSFIEIRKMYINENSTLERIYSKLSFLNGKFFYFNNAMEAGVDQYEYYPYLARYTTNNADFMNPKPFLDRNVSTDNNGQYINWSRKNTPVVPDENGYAVVYSDLLDTKGRTVHVGTTNEDSGFVHYGPITGDEPANFSNSTYDPSKYDEFGHLKDGSGGSNDDPTNPTDPTNSNITTARFAGKDRFETSLAIAKQYVGTGTLDNVVISYGYGFADALAGSTLAKKLDCPILLVGSLQDSTDSLDYIASKLSKSGHIYLLGGTGVVPDSFKDWFVSKGYSSDNIVRLGGATREGTAQQIVQELSVEAGTPVIIASEENFPDALSISSIASYKGYPVLLTRHDSLPDYVKTYLSTEKPSKVYIIGGTGAISSDVAAAVQNSAGLSSSSVIRLAGSSRYETSLAIAKEFDLGSKNITLVNGNDYPDAISGSVLSAKYQSPIILTDNNTSLTSIKSFVNSKGITNIYTLGGTGVLPDSSVNKLK